MTNKFLLWSLMTAVCLGGAFTSCSDDNDNGGGSDENTEETTPTGYILATGVDESDYLLTADTLTEGSVTAISAGKEVDAATAWVFYKDQYLYNLVYNQGNAGETGSFYLDSNGAVTQRSNVYSIIRFVTYAALGDYIVTASAVDSDITDDNGNVKKAFGFNYLHAEDQTLTTSTVDACENLLGNGEYVTFAGFVEIDGKYYTSVVPMGMSVWGVQNYAGTYNTDKVAQEAGGSSSSAYSAGSIPATQYPDSAYIAIYDDITFKSTPTIVRTDKMGFACGRMRSQYYQTIQADDDGNLYVFSPGYGRMHTSTYYTTGNLEARVMRINAGEEAFDSSYGNDGYVSIEELSDGCSFLRVWHITDDYFLLQMFSKIDTNASNPGYLNAKGTGATSLAIYRGSTQKFSYVTGLPDADVISSFGSTPYSENGYAYVGIVTSDGANPTVYQINPITAKATAGLEVIAEDISAIGKLVLQE